MSAIFGHPAVAERPYPGCSYVARIDFEYGPRAFQRGEPFDLAALGLTESQASDLWIAGRLSVAPADSVAPPASTVKVAATSSERASAPQSKRKGA